MFDFDFEPDFASNKHSDVFEDDDFNMFFTEDVLTSRDVKGNWNFELKHKLIDVDPCDIELALINEEGVLLGGGDDERITGSPDDIRLITQKARVYSSPEQLDLKLPGMRVQQIEQLTRLKELYLRKLKFYFDEDSHLMNNWELAACQHNQLLLNKCSNFRCGNKRLLVKLVVETDWLRCAHEYIKENKLSVSTYVNEENVNSNIGLNLGGIYAMDELSGSAPRIIKNIALSVFSNNHRERAESKLDLVLTRNAHKFFAADKICQTMLRICKAANLSFLEYHHFIQHLRDNNLASCPCGHKGASTNNWPIHDCTYEAWLIRLGLAVSSNGFIILNNSGSWDDIIFDAGSSLRINI